MNELIGFNRDCNRSTLGVDRLYFISGARVESLNFDQLDRVSSIQTIEGAKWQQAKFLPGEATFRQNQTREGGFPKTTQNIGLNYSSIYSGVLRAIRRLGDASRLHLIAVTVDGRAYYCGVNFWPEKGYKWETTTLEVVGGDTEAGNLESGSSLGITLQATGRNYAPLIVANLEDLEFDPVPDGDPVPDNAPPFVINQYPADNSGNVDINPGFFRLYFNEVVKWTGAPATIELYETGVGVIKSWVIGTSPGLFFDQSDQSFTISTGIPTLTNSTDYHFLFTSGIEDLSGNDWAGYSSATDWNFTTKAAPSVIQLAISSLSPADDSTGVDSTSVDELVITYDNDAAPGSGSFVLWKKTTGNPSIVGIYNVLSGSVSFSGGAVTIATGLVLESDSEYFVQITPGAVISSDSGISHPGISDETTWNFTTIDAGPPSYVSFTPVSESTDNTYDPTTVSFQASENLAEGSGTIYIKNWDDDSTLISFPASDAAVSISGPDVTFDLSGFSDLPPFQRIYFEMAAGTFEDLAGNDLPALTKAGSDTWNYTTEKPPLMLTVEPLTGDGAQTIGFWVGNENHAGVLVVEWESGMFSRYEVAASASPTQVSNVFGSETSDNINLFFIGNTNASSEIYELDQIQFLNQSQISGITFIPDSTFGFIQISGSTTIQNLTNLDSCNILDGLTLASNTNMGITLDFESNGGFVGSGLFVSLIDDIAITMGTNTGHPVSEIQLSDCDNLAFDFGTCILPSSGAITMVVNTCNFVDDGVVINNFVTQLSASLSASSAGASGGTLSFTGQRIDYTTGTASDTGWQSIWEILNIPASVSSWAFSFDDTVGPLSVVETSETAIDQIVESTGIPVGVMVGYDGGNVELHDYTASGTSRTTISRSGLPGTSVVVWMAFYFADGFLFSSVVDSIDMVHDAAVSTYRVEAYAFPSGRIIHDLGDGSILQTTAVSYSPSAVTRNITPDAGTYSGAIYIGSSCSYFRDRGGSLQSVDFTNCGTSLDDIRIGSSSLVSATIPQAILDAIRTLNISGIHGDFTGTYDLTSNTALSTLSITSSVGALVISLRTGAGAYASISSVSFSSSTLAQMDLTGLSLASSLTLTKFKSTGSEHIMPSAMPNLTSFSQTNANANISPIAFDLANFPEVINLFWTGGDLSSIAKGAGLHGNISVFQAAPYSTWSQSNTLDFTLEEQLSILSISGTGSLGQLDLPTSGNGANLRTVIASNLLSASDCDRIIDALYIIRAENTASGKFATIVPASGTISATSTAKIDGTGAYDGDGLVDNNWTITT